MITTSATRDNIADRAAVSADHAIKATQGALNHALDRLADDVHDLQQQASPMVDRASGQAQALARNSMAAVRSTSQHLRDSVHSTTDSAKGYIREEPVKAVLIAALAGAALVGLLSLLGHGDRRQP